MLNSGCRETRSEWIMTPSQACCCMTAVLGLWFALWSEKNMFDPLFLLLFWLAWFGSWYPKMSNSKVFKGDHLCYLLTHGALSSKAVHSVLKEQGYFPPNWQVLHNGHLVPASPSLPLFENASYRCLNLRDDFPHPQAWISGCCPLPGTAWRSMKDSEVPPWGQSSALHSCLSLF